MEKFLPSKSQVILKCDMSAWQKVYYQQVTDVGRVGLDNGLYLFLVFRIILEPPYLTSSNAVFFPVMFCFEYLCAKGIHLFLSYTAVGWYSKPMNLVYPIFWVVNCKPISPSVAYQFLINMFYHLGNGPSYVGFFSHDTKIS